MIAPTPDPLAEARALLARFHAAFSDAGGPEKRELVRALEALVARCEAAERERRESERREVAATREMLDLRTANEALTKAATDLCDFDEMTMREVDMVPSVFHPRRRRYVAALRTALAPEQQNRDKCAKCGFEWKLGDSVVLVDKALYHADCQPRGEEGPDPYEGLPGLDLRLKP